MHHSPAPTHPPISAPTSVRLKVAADLRLGDIANLNASIETEIECGAQQIRLVGARCMTEGSRLALIGTHRRLLRNGIELLVETR